MEDQSSRDPQMRGSSPSLFVSLPKPPTAFSLTVRKLLGRVLDGAIRVPSFQRPLRWQAADVVKLLDSILKGYPIGSLLFWKHRLGPDTHLRIRTATIGVPENLETTRRALAHWLWRGVATGVHQRAAVSAMRFQVRVIRDDDRTGSLERRLEAVGEPSAREWSLDPFHAKHAASRVELLALLSRGPRDASGPVSWRALLSSGERVAREIFRIDQYPDGPLRGLACTAANRVLLDARHSNLRTELRKWSWEAHRDAFESHLIDEAGYAELDQNDAESFLTRRAARVRTLVSAFISQRAGLGSPIVRPVETYYDAPSDGLFGDDEL